MSKEGFVNIHGKEYKTVAKRVQEFRESEISRFWTINTDVVKIDDDQVLIKASIINNEGRVIATGHGHELRTASQINKTSYVENAETSAIGRALASLGLGGTEFASANEVANAIHQQTTQKAIPKPTIIKATDGAMENLDEESQQFIKDLAIDIIGDVAGGHIEYAYGKTTTLLNEEKLAVWTLLDSKTRSTLKKHAESLKGK
jgi:hypothetical protein